ncbi:unnamed protein product [Lactuca virosa]|uniref:Uncharacterized protein n=1 Tax=Lactuca virosa TaxID=75947 RepID=A0AAU9P8G2_9ASTR|nr:unnamed protein product [Lactuca virosa]
MPSSNVRRPPLSSDFLSASLYFIGVLRLSLFHLKHRCFRFWGWPEIWRIWSKCNKFLGRILQIRIRRWWMKQIQLNQKYGG